MTDRLTRAPVVEWRSLRVVVFALCAIAVGASIRRLVALAAPSAGGPSEFAALDAFFAAKPGLTRAHVIAGLLLAVAVPVQLSSRIRGRHPWFHRWLGRTLVAIGILVGISAYAMVAAPVGGWIEVSAIVFYATAFLGALMVAWRQIRRGDVGRHREWMLRAMGIALGVATARPVMGLFFATRPLTNLTAAEFFGLAMWIGFTATTAAAELYVRATRPNRRSTEARGPLVAHLRGDRI